MVFVTLTLLQVAVEEQECPFPRYLPLCIYSEAVTYLKEVIEELSNKIEQIQKDTQGFWTQSTFKKKKNGLWRATVTLQLSW